MIGIFYAPVKKNTDAILIGGTTGEGLFLTSTEKAKMAQHAKKNFKGKIIIGINDIKIDRIKDLILKTEDTCDFFPVIDAILHKAIE